MVYQNLVSQHNAAYPTFYSWNFRFITALMRTCRAVHDDVAEYIYSRVIWSPQIVPHNLTPLPREKIPHYEAHVRLHRIYVDQRLTDESGIMPAEVARYAVALSESSRIRTLHIEIHAPSEAALLRITQELGPLRDRVDAVSVERLWYQAQGNYHLSNCAYQLLRADFVDVKEWSFPLVEAQYKD